MVIWSSLSGRFPGRDIAPLTPEIRRGSEIHRLGAEVGVSPLDGGGREHRARPERGRRNPDQAGPDRAPLARSYSTCRGFESLLRHTGKAPQTPRVRGFVVCGLPRDAREATLGQRLWQHPAHRTLVDRKAATPSRPRYLRDKRRRVVPARANGQLAFGNYRWDEQREAFEARSLSVLTFRPRGDRQDHHLPRCRAAFALRAPGRALDKRWISSPCRIPPGTAAVSAIKDTPDLKDIMSDVNGNMERTPINPVSRVP